MKVIIVGAGKVGETLVEYFTKENHDIIIIDSDFKTVQDIVNKYDVRGVVGGGVERDVLLEAEANTADFFIASTPRDELNVLACVLAKKLGAKYTVARVRSPEYFKESETLKTELDLDMLFNPEYRTAVEISRVLKMPSATNIESFAGGKALMVEFHIEKGNPLVGKTVMEINKESYVKVLFGMVTRKDEAFTPRGDTVIMEDDIVHIIASEPDIVAFCKKLKLFKHRARSVFIIGGSKTAYYLAEIFDKTDVSVKILDINEKRCKELSELLPGTVVLLGDGTDQDVLDEEGLSSCDACLTLTGIDEENVIISLYARKIGVDKIITKVNRSSVLKMVKDLGLDSVVSPHNVIANHILQFTRSRQTTDGEGVKALYKISANAEALEFTVSKNFPYLGVELKNLKLRKDILVGGIVRDGEFILPGGNTAFNAGDRVIILTTQSTINDLKQIVK